MFQWLTEVADETNWGEGRGLRIMNGAKPALSVGRHQAQVTFLSALTSSSATYGVSIFLICRQKRLNSKSPVKQVEQRPRRVVSDRQRLQGKLLLGLQGS